MTEKRRPRTPERNAELRRRRLAKALMAHRSSLGLCFNCGGKEFVPSVDNCGGQYMGCARCVIVIPEGMAK